MTGYDFSESMNEDQLAKLSQLLVDQGAENVVLSGVENIERYGSKSNRLLLLPKRRKLPDHYA